MKLRGLAAALAVAVAGGSLGGCASSGLTLITGDHNTVTQSNGITITASKLQYPDADRARLSRLITQTSGSR
ncbi:MAG: hypothetical protein WDN10_00470 [bacterium]